MQLRAITSAPRIRSRFQSTLLEFHLGLGMEFTTGTSKPTAMMIERSWLLGKLSKTDFGAESGSSLKQDMKIRSEL